MMLHIPQVLTPQQVSHIRSELQRADWVDGRETVGEQGARVKRNRQLPEHSPLGFQLGEIILEALR
ncbi:PKHD-type hydroxylase, partial [Acinetobacter baumannii]